VPRIFGVYQPLCRDFPIARVRRVLSDYEPAVRGDALSETARCVDALAG